MRPPEVAWDPASAGLHNPPAACCSSQAAPPTAPVWLQRLQLWMRAIQRHRRGMADEHSRLVASWTSGEMEAARDDLLGLRDALQRAHALPLDRVKATSVRYRDGRFGVSEAQGWLGLTDEEARAGDVNRILWAGALLYTDVALRGAPDERAVIGRTTVVRLRDGQVDGFEYSARPIWEAARALLDAIRPDPGTDGAVALWYKATAASLLGGTTALSDATAQLERGRHIFPSDADLLYYSGCLHENFAAAYFREAARSASLPPGHTIPVGSMRAHLRDAEGFFRKAIAGNGRMAEARVRLGRVLGFLQRHDEAAAELRQAVAATKDPRLLYYARMLLGDEEQALEHRDAARECYERAAEDYPEAQSPLLALSHLALRSGDRAAAIQAAGHLMRLPVDGREDDAGDPWPEYYARAGSRAGAWWAALYAAVPQPPGE